MTDADTPRIVVGLPQVPGDVEGAVDAARAAEDAGAWGVSVFDHLVPPWRTDGPALEGWTLLALCARATSRVRLVSLVTRTGVRPPALVVRQAAAVQAASGGRLVLGLGLGDAGTRAEERRFGVRGPARRGRMAEVERIARAWDGGSPVRPRGEAPPLWVAGPSDGALRLAADVADAWHGWGMDPGAFDERAARVRELAGHDLPSWWGGMFDPSTAREQLASYAGAAGITWMVRSAREPDDREALLGLCRDQSRGTR